MIVVGVILGFFSGLAHSLAYLASRWFTVRGRGSSWQLLVVSHVQLGLITAAAMGFAWPSGLTWDWAWGRPALTGAVVLAVSQASLFGALRHADASTVAPLLSGKIAVLALLTTVGVYGPAQAVSLFGWLGVGLAIAGAFLIQGFGTPPSLKAWAWIVLMVMGYAWCDLSIVASINAVVAQQAEAGLVAADTVAVRVRAGVFVATLLYTGTGIIALACSPWLGSRRREVWRDALPYTLSWAAAMVFLYSTFALLGVVYGAILQGTRALWSVVLGGLIAHRGGHGIETVHHRRVLGWRVVAALFMVGAVALYALAV